MFLNYILHIHTCIHFNSLFLVAFACEVFGKRFSYAVFSTAKHWCLVNGAENKQTLLKISVNMILLVIIITCVATIQG